MFLLLIHSLIFFLSHSAKKKNGLPSLVIWLNKVSLVKKLIASTETENSDLSAQGSDSPSVNEETRRQGHLIIINKRVGGYRRSLRDTLKTVIFIVSLYISPP